MDLVKEKTSRLISIMKDVVYTVEATSFEQQCLWERYEDGNYPLKLSSDGWGISVGNLNGANIQISTRLGFYRGESILFWEATSDVVKYSIIEESISLYGLPKTDAQNFHNCIRHIDKLVDENSVNFIKED